MRFAFIIIAFFSLFDSIGQNWAPLELGVNHDVRCMLSDTTDSSLLIVNKKLIIY